MYKISFVKFVLVRLTYFTIGELRLGVNKAPIQFFICWTGRLFEWDAGAILKKKICGHNQWSVVAKQRFRIFVDLKEGRNERKEGNLCCLKKRAKGKSKRME